MLELQNSESFESKWILSVLLLQRNGGWAALREEWLHLDTEAARGEGGGREGSGGACSYGDAALQRPPLLYLLLLLILLLLLLLLLPQHLFAILV